ncbi:MAG: hypothetical protein FWD58_05665 [Firmicutes bacterium]|nr:hypothetical protein [Bacillota bacterium]
MNDKFRRLCPKAFWFMLVGLLGCILFVGAEFLMAFFTASATGHMWTSLFDTGFEEGGNYFILDNSKMATIFIIAIPSVLLAAYVAFMVFTIINSAKRTSGVYSIIALCFCTAMAIYCGVLLAYHLVQVYEMQSLIRIENLKDYPEIPRGTDELLGKARIGVLIYVIGILTNAAVGVGVVLQRLFIRSGKQYYGKSKAS